MKLIAVSASMQTWKRIAVSSKVTTLILPFGNVPLTNL